MPYGKSFFMVKELYLDLDENITKINENLYLCLKIQMDADFTFNILLCKTRWAYTQIQKNYIVFGQWGERKNGDWTLREPNQNPLQNHLVPKTKPWRIELQNFQPLAKSAQGLIFSFRTFETWVLW